MKLVGLLFLAASFLGFTLVRLNTYNLRFSILKRLISFLEHIERELSVQPVQLQEMFSAIAGKVRTEDSAIFFRLSEALELLGDKGFQEIWEENIDFFFSSLSVDEKHEIYRIGAKLGFCPVEMQLKCISGCRKYFTEILQKEKKDYPQNRKLYLGLTAAAAGAMIIVFI